MASRTCIACRKVFGKGELLRFVEVEGRVSFDPLNKMEGRGAYLCRDKACIEKAGAQPGLLARAFGKAVEAPNLKELLFEL